MVNTTFKLGWLQTASQGDLAKNAQVALEGCHQLADDGVNIIFLQELMFSDYFPIREDIEKFDVAMDLDHDSIKSFQAFAKEREVFVCLPFFERRAPGLYHNSCAVLSDQGEVMDLYRKMHIPDDPCFYEKYYFSPGDRGWKVVDCGGLKVGILICWDQWYPEAARLTTMEGADLLYYPTAIGWDAHEPSEWYEEQLDSWKTILRSHSIANGCYTLAVNRVGEEENLKFWGNSFLSSPTGKVIHADATEASAVVQTIDISDIERQRRAWPFFRDRRIDAYDGLTSRWGKNSDKF